MIVAAQKDKFRTIVRINNPHFYIHRIGVIISRMLELVIAYYGVK